MEFVVELILELLLEGGIEVSSNKKISKWIRYPILAFLILFFSVIIFGIIILGLFLLPQSIFGGIFITLVGLFMLIMAIYKFKKRYLEVTIKKR